MSLVLKPANETYRGDFSFRNSDAAIARFPFPFPDDRYMYSVNMEPAVSRDPGSVFEHPFDIDEHYRSEMAERALVLERDPRRSVALPYMETAGWETLEMIMRHLAADYPEWFSLECHGDQWHWTNHALDLRQRFTLGDAATLPYDPLEYIMRQTQGDMALLDQRDGDLFMDAGVVTGPADWSIAFDAGMSFRQWHSPVPLAHQMGVFDRALKFLLAIQPGHPARRLNWTLTINPRLDTSTETWHQWGAERGQVTPENVGQIVHLRVELQFMARLPRSHALLFGIRTYLCSMADLVKNPAWARRLHRVLRDLPAPLVEYKGIARYHETLVNWLAPFDR